MLVTPGEAAALLSTRDPRTVKRNFQVFGVGANIRYETADLANGDAGVEARMITEVIGMRTGTTAYSGRNGPRQLAADNAALQDARGRASEEARAG